MTEQTPFLEERIASVLKNAANSGDIPDIVETDILTDASGYSEWMDRPKIYVLRKSTDTLGSLSGSDRYESTVVFSCLCENKEEAGDLMEKVFSLIIPEISGILGVTEWVTDSIDAAPLFDGQRFREQYYAIWQIRVFHTIF